MSMSQEEIESLMNGLDIDDDESSNEPSVEENIPEGNMSEDDINDLIAQTEEISSPTEVPSSEESVDDLLNSLDNTDIEKSSEDETNIDDILKELEQSDPVEESPDVEIPAVSTEESAPAMVEAESVSNDNIDELLSTIDSIDDVPEEIPVVPEVSNDITSQECEVKGRDDIDSKIDNGLFPLPVEDDTKVVNQLSEVATDSEEKATKIFDVLSNILDYNNGIQNDVQALSTFNDKQIAMLASLSQKFPNIDVFQDNLNQAQEMGKHILDVNDKLNNGNTEIFQAMELMQYHDINRQKIERVMSVIRKLSNYLNNLFEDDNNRQEVAVANHIHGDSTDDLVADDDLEALIAEFNN